MLDTLPHLFPASFPALRRGPLETLQVNLGYLCNQQCRHCHVDAGPRRQERMDAATAARVLEFLRREPGVTCLDLTGGAPELNPNFRDLVRGARALGKRVIDRSNLTVLSEPGQADLAEFLARQGVEVTASLPCYLEQNVDQQRGAGVFSRSLDGLRRLNALGYGAADSGLLLDLVYNPLGPYLPPPQCSLEQDYKRFLRESHGVVFNRLLTLCNVPVRRFGSALLSSGEFEAYLELLRGAHREENLAGVMCRSLVSVDWRGQVFDCDFNQMLGLPLPRADGGGVEISQLDAATLPGTGVSVAEHCYACTAGQGSSCGGALS